MPDRGDRDCEEMFTQHPDLIQARWAKLSQQAERKHIRRVWRGQLGGRIRRISVQRLWLITVAVAVTALLVLVHLWFLPGGAKLVAATPPTTTMTTRPSASLDLNHPFATTPAAAWGDGAASIALPPAVPLSGHSATQVADALRRAKQALVAAYLDNRMLFNHDLRGYLALFAPGTQVAVRRSLSGYPGVTNTLLAPGFHLLPAPIKVNGTMSVGTNQQGDLVVHTNYVFAYPFAPSNPSEIAAAWQIVAIHHIRQDFELVTGNNYATADQGLWPGASQSYGAAMACGPSKQGLLAPAYSEPHLGIRPGQEDPDALYDPNHPMNIPDSCPP